MTMMTMMTMQPPLLSEVGATVIVIISPVVLTLQCTGDNVEKLSKTMFIVRMEITMTMFKREVAWALVTWSKEGLDEVARYGEAR